MKDRNEDDDVTRPEWEAVGQRLKELRGRQNQAEFAGMLEVGLSSYARYEQGKRAPDGDLLLRLQRDGVSLDWLLAGVGSKRWRPLVEGDESASASAIVMIPLYNLKLGGGSGRINWETEKIGERGFHRDWLKKKGLKPEHLGLGKLVGRSMEPFIIEDDLVLFDRADTNVRSGKPYFIRVRDELMCKYLSQQPDGSILCSSENAQMFPPFVMPAAFEEESQIIGRVRSTSREWD